MGNDVTVTLAGFMGTSPRLFASPTGNDFTSFRIASTTRYLDRTRGEWVDGRTIWFTVKAWRGMAQNVVASLRKGDAVVVTGRLAVDEWTSPEGPRTNLVIEASALGPDLTRGQARFSPTVHRPTTPDGAAHGQAAAAPEPGAGSENTLGLLAVAGGDTEWDLGALGEPVPKDDDAEHGLVDDALGLLAADDGHADDEDGAVDQEAVTHELLATR
ncbi:single-stranded DNA-binding protein [Oerskovia enterophila]|uniref:Single-stranded DNA-binding protein n=1 Tax=Oerskovia enterophila TaxID=43678 RepID=A0A163T753_9CELL|nr:single-stranded DNA-binding protein [Oerskovia enterophila]KZM37185.1 single-stranded DNA-binding protein [Oerskovia enterophila]